MTEPPVTASSAEQDDAVVQWFVFFSEKHQREYYFEPKTKTTTWIMPDDLHPYPRTAERSSSNNAAKNVKMNTTRRVGFHDPVSSDTFPPRSHAVLVTDDFEEVVKPRKRSTFCLVWILFFGLILITVSLVALLKAGIAFDGISIQNVTTLSEQSELPIQSDSHIDMSTTQKRIGDPPGNFECSCACNDTTSVLFDGDGSTTKQPNSVDEETDESTIQIPSRRRGFFPLTLVICRDCSRLLAQNGHLLVTFKNISIVRYDPFR